ncbi:MAG: hypothetical protein IIW79_01205 [Clostridia bacterium]|nr:hypothetical protein [Clostridia bacterium]
MEIKRKILLLISTAFALCLFFSPSPMPALFAVAAFLAALAIISFDKLKIAVTTNGFSRIVAVLVTLLIEFKGIDKFRSVWVYSSKVAAVTNRLNLSVSMFVLAVGIVCCIVGFFAIYSISNWGIALVSKLLLESLPERKKENIVANLKQNWYLPISAMAFFCLNMIFTYFYLPGIPVAFVIMIVVASQVTSVWDQIRQNSVWTHIFCGASALGVCLATRINFYTECLKLMEKLSLPQSFDKIFLIVSYLGVAVAVLFVYFCIQLFWKKVAQIFTETQIFSDVKKSELIIYGLLFALTLGYMIFSFAKTDAFYGTPYLNDVIYTSDSPSLVKDNVYLVATHPENDLRQPLFALFAAPFIGLPYLIGRVLDASASVQAMLVDTVQIVMLFGANFILTKMLKLDCVKRVSFMLLTTFTYTYLLFTLMMEQYLIAYFWLIFGIYIICEKRRLEQIALWGAGGTLLTSMTLLPFMSKNNPIRNFKEYVIDMVKYGMSFVLVILTFCRADIFLKLTRSVSSLSSFTGRDVGLIDKVNQYFTFIQSCFVAPKAGLNTTAVDHISWQMEAVTGISIIGVVILALAIISAILNRRNKSSLFAIGWVAFSVVILFVLGWGTKENGQILYALYFGWAFLVLLFQLVEKIETKLKVRFITPLFSVGCSVAMAVVNIPAIMEMMSFASNHFPVQ